MCVEFFILHDFKMTSFCGKECGKEPACQCRRRKGHGFDPWVRKMLCRRAWQLTPSILAWRIPWTEEPGGVQVTVLQRARHNWNNLECTHFSHSFCVSGIQAENIGEGLYVLSNVWSLAERFKDRRLESSEFWFMPASAG